MSLYAGINGVPKKITKIYAGNNGTLSNVPVMQSDGKIIYQDKIDIDKELEKINPIKAITSGQITKDYIGRTVMLSNGGCTCQEWIIVGVNCQNELGSVDLISKSTLWNKCGESGGQPSANTYMSYDNDNLSDAKTTLVDGLSTNSMQYYLNNQVIPGFTKDVQDALQPMDVEYMNDWYNGKYGGDYHTFYRSQKICVPGDGDIRLYLENGTAIVESFPGGGVATWRTDTYCGFGRPYFDHDIKWYKSSSSGMEYNSSVSSYSTQQLLAIAKTPMGEQIKYPLRSCVYNNSHYRYYINTNGRRESTYRSYFDSTYTVGAIIRLGNPAFNNISGVDPIEYLQSGKMSSIYLGRRVKLSMADGSTSTWVVADVSKAGTKLLFIANSNYTAEFSTDGSSIYETSNIRSYVNTGFYNKLSSTVKNALKMQSYNSNGKTLMDRIVLASATELGFTSNESISFMKEGEPLQVFSSGILNCKSCIGSTAWTRTRNLSGTSKAITAYGEMDTQHVSYARACAVYITI